MSVELDAAQAIGLAVEGARPLCKAPLRVHDDRACCTCFGDSYRVASGHLDVKSALNTGASASTGS